LDCMKKTIRKLGSERINKKVDSFARVGGTMRNCLFSIFVCPNLTQVSKRKL
jgi:hypothetical protein